MKRIICFLKKHKSGKTKYNCDLKGSGIWKIECVRCKYKIEYRSPWARLVGTEMKFGFDGKYNETNS